MLFVMLLLYTEVQVCLKGEMLVPLSGLRTELTAFKMKSLVLQG